jgi:hypothetical protein
MHQRHNGVNRMNENVQAVVLFFVVGLVVFIVTASEGSVWLALALAAVAAGLATFAVGRATRRT